MNCGIIHRCNPYEEELMRIRGIPDESEFARFNIFQEYRFTQFQLPGVVLAGQRADPFPDIR